MNTYIAKNDEVEASRRWFVVDADGQILGRLASRVAAILRGKNKAFFSPHQDAGDFVVIVNAEKIKVTGNKLKAKTYFHHSGYPGGEKITPLNRMMRQHPERVLELAVKRMLPKNALGRKMFRKLKVYAGPEHPHQAQSPEPLKFN